MKYYKAYIFVINLKIEEFFKEPFHGPLTKLRGVAPVHEQPL